jgi:hypothetical protein
MSDDRETVLQVVDVVGKWDVMLAGIKGEEVIIVSKKECPSEIRLGERKVRIRRFDPEEYLRIVCENESLFRDYKMVYFVKVYMRKILDLLASLEVYRLSKDFSASE